MLGLGSVKALVTFDALRYSAQVHAKENTDEALDEIYVNFPDPPVGTGALIASLTLRFWLNHIER